MKDTSLCTGVTRREFLKGCSYVAATVLMGGCSKSSGSSNSETPGTLETLDDTYSFNIHPSADVLDSVQTFVKFQTNKLDAVVESSQPMFMLTAPSVSHDGSFKPLSKTYGQPEILHLDNNNDGNTYVEINTNSHKNNIGLVKERINIGTTPKIQRSNGLSYTYNDIVSCNGSQHNTVNENGKFISQKMAIVAANSKMALGDDWNDIEQWYDIMSSNGFDALSMQLQLIYQYDEIDAIGSSTDSDTSSAWKTIHILDSLNGAWTDISDVFDTNGWALSPLDTYFGVSIDDVSMYTNEIGKDFLYGTVSIGYFYSVGFIVTFDGDEPEIHWYMPEETGFYTNESGKDMIKYNARYALLSMLVNNSWDNFEPITPNLQVPIDVFLSTTTLDFGLKNWEKFLGKVIFKPMFVDDAHVIMRYQTLDGMTLDTDTVKKLAAFIKVPLKSRSDRRISIIETQDPSTKVEAALNMVETLSVSGPVTEIKYSPNINNSSTLAATVFDNLYALQSNIFPETKSFIGVGSTVSDGNRLLMRNTDYISEPFNLYFIPGGDLSAGWDDSAQTPWYIEHGLIPDSAFPLTEYMNDAFDVKYSRNHENIITVSIIPTDSTKLTFEWKIDEKILMNDNPLDIKVPQPVGVGIKRVLPWNNYLHESELLYVGLEQKNIAPLSNGANAGSLRDLTHQSSSEAESYFYAYNDYLEKNWKLIELQTAPPEAPKQVDKITKVKQRLHQATLVITDQNNNAVTLSENLHVEIRCNSGAIVQDITYPEKIKKVHLNRTTSYLAKDDGKGHVKLQIDVGHEGDLLTGVDLHYRIVDAGDSGIAAFPSSRVGSPEKVLNVSEKSLTGNWSSFNISYALHNRMAHMDKNQPTVPKDTVLMQDIYSDNIAHKYASQKDQIISSTKTAYDKISKVTAVKDTGMTFLRNSVEKNSPLYSVITMNGSTLAVSVGSWDDVEDAWNRVKHIINTAKRAAAEVIEKIKDFIHKLINNLDDIFKGLAKSVSGILNAVEAFCDSVIDGTKQLLDLLLHALLPFVDLKMAFSVGMGMKDLLATNFTSTSSGVFGQVKKDVQGNTLNNFIKEQSAKMKNKTTLIPDLSLISTQAVSTIDDIQSAIIKNATQMNYVKNILSVNIDFTSITKPSPVEFYSISSSQNSISEDVGNIFTEVEGSIQNIMQDILKGDFSKTETDFSTAIGTTRGDIADIGEEIFTEAIKDLEKLPAELLNLLEHALPDFIKVILNDIIKPLFKLDRDFENAVDILYFLLGYGTNLILTAGTNTMKFIASDSNVDFSKLIANQGKYQGKTASIMGSYKGLDSTLNNSGANGDLFEDITIAVIGIHLAVSFLSVGTAMAVENGRDEAEEILDGLDTYLEVYEVVVLASELAMATLKEVALALHKDESQTVDIIMNTMLVVLKFIKVLPYFVPLRQDRAALKVLSGGCSFFVNLVAAIVKNENYDEKKASYAAISETVADAVEVIYALSIAEAPIDPKLEFGFVGTVSALNILTDVLEIDEVSKD